jgi:hypothetical protein
MSPQPHISNALLQRIQFALFCFRSPLLTESLLISIPPGTETFHFPGFPDLFGLIWEVPFGHLWFKGCIRLARAFRS